MSAQLEALPEAEGLSGPTGMMGGKNGIAQRWLLQAVSLMKDSFWVQGTHRIISLPLYQQ